MIETRPAFVVVIRCDECANTFTGDYDEPLDDVVWAARARGWDVSGVRGGTLCPATRMRRRDEVASDPARPTDADQGKADGSATDRKGSER